MNMKVGIAGFTICLVLSVVSLIYYQLTDINIFTQRTLWDVSPVVVSTYKAQVNVKYMDSKDSAEEHINGNQSEQNIKVIYRFNDREPNTRLQTPTTLVCGEYQCYISHGRDQKISDKADLLYFIIHDLRHYKTPPLKVPQSLWAFVIHEPPTIMDLTQKQSSQWNGLFNYSLSYLRDDESSAFAFRHELKRKFPPSNQYFYPTQSMRQPRALQFNSHCSDPSASNNNLVYSARDEYLLELSKYIHVDVYTRHSRKLNTCFKTLSSVVRNSEGGPDPSFEDYPFYLAFENSLCQDYITEKFWKILQSNCTTIPVVLGGLSIEDYELVAPPNSFIHVRNFTSPEALANHLKFVVQDDNAFHYYNQWRNEYHPLDKYVQRGNTFVGDYTCYMCQLAHERPHRVWNTFSKDYGKHQCVDVTKPKDHCPYYNLSCNH